MVDIVLGQTWRDAIPFLQAFAVVGMMRLSFVGYWAYLARGVSGALLRFTIASVALKVVFIVVGSRFGAIGVAAGFALAATVSWPLSFWWLSRATPIPLARLLASAMRVLLLGLLAVGSAALAAEATASANSICKY